MCITPMRSASAKASSWSCVTRMVVVPSRRCTSRTVRRSSDADLGVERAEGLVEQQHLRFVGQRARHRDALLLAAGELRRQAVVHAIERHQPQQLRAPLAPLRRPHAPDAQRELDVLAHRHVAEERVVLEHETNAALAGVHEGDVAPVQRDAAVIDAGQAGNSAQQRALAAAARPEQHEELAARDLERDVVDDGHAAVAFRDLFELDGHAGSTFLRMVGSRGHEIS